MSPEAVSRYEEIRLNIEVLRDDGLIPNTVERAADVGFGSGGGSIALAELFPQAIVTAIDDASSQQGFSRYRRRTLPRWTSRIEFVPDDLKAVASKLGGNDIVLASRIPFSDMNKRVDWKIDSLDAAKTLVALALLVKPKTGVVIVGYDPHEDPGALWELGKRLDAGKLFSNLKRYQVENGDDWLVLGGVDQGALIASKSDPEILLTDVGKKLPPMSSFAEYLKLNRSLDDKR